jgi:IMP dehydrogenase
MPDTRPRLCGFFYFPKNYEEEYNAEGKISMYTETQQNSIVKKYLSKKGLPFNLGLTFEDVTIIDQYSAISSRADIPKIQTRLAEGVILHAPIISANMDTVTESKMAIALARLGGMGVIHQFLPIQKRIEEVKKVKRADNFIIENPISISADASIRKAKKLMELYQISTLLVAQESTKKLLGILSNRDTRFETNDERPVKDIMTPMPLVTASPLISVQEAKKIFHATKKEKIPLIDANGYIKGLITAKDILKTTQFKDAFRDKKGRLGVGVAVGIGDEMLSETEQLLDAGADMIIIDTARGNSERLVSKIKEVRKKFGKDIALMAGNVDTPDGVERLARAGADCIKVGIGGGAACKTRRGPGVGIPQVTAIATAAAMAEKMKCTIIGDGGIKNSSDFCKALGAGAYATMIGGLFGGTEEAPGKVFYEDGKEWKVYRGSASVEFQLSRLDRNDPEKALRTPEGVAKRVPYKGSVQFVVQELMGHLRSSLSYAGTPTIDEFRHKARFLQQTLAGLEEGKPHDVA